MKKENVPKICKGQQALMPEQEEYARQFAQERIASMLSTTAVDEQEAERHLREAYRVAVLEPVKVRWFDSPITFASACVWASVGASVWASVRDSVRDSVWASVGDSVGASVRDSVGASVGASVWASVGASVGAYLNENWLSFYQFFHEVFQDNDLIHLALFNEMVSGYRLGTKEAWLVRKPVRLERDSEGRLHSADGMCIRYPDGWGFYAWHGVRCSEKIIMHPESLTKENWVKEGNLEVRRVIQERMSDRFVTILNGKVIDQGRRGTLYEVDISPDPECIAKYLHVKDSSTEREYYLRVPPTMKTAQEAVAWTFGLSEQGYQPVQEA